KAPEGCWHDLVLGALQPLSEEDRDADGKLWRFRKGTPSTTDKNWNGQEEKTTTPAWLTTIAPASPAAMMVLRPSDANHDAPPSTIGGGRPRPARLRGPLPHRLLQSLPDIPAARRENAAAEFQSRRGGELSAAQRADLLQEVLLVIENRDFAPLFAHGSRAEVSIGGKIAMANGTTLVVPGRIDRLVGTSDAVLIAGFKTNPDPPGQNGTVPPEYIRHVALYPAGLAKFDPQ